MDNANKRRNLDNLPILSIQKECVVRLSILFRGITIGIIEDAVANAVCILIEKGPEEILSSGLLTSAWLRKVAIRLLIRDLNKHYKAIFSLELIPEEPDGIVPIKEEKPELTITLESLLLSIPRAKALLVRSHAIDGYSFEEIAKETGAKSATLRKRYQRAIEQMKNNL